MPSKTIAAALGFFAFSPAYHLAVALLVCLVWRALKVRSRP
jgi:hypothetical protein